VNEPIDLAGFGWSAHFAQQQAALQDEALVPARVLAVHRSTVDVGAPGLAKSLPQPLGANFGPLTVGDWVMIDRQSGRIARLFERASLFRRRAAGIEAREQLIAANVDTLFVVSSCNNDFNEARLERYLAIGREAGVMAVIVLTKADLSDDPAAYAGPASRLAPGIVVETVNALDPCSLECLEPWLAAGQTIAMLGSSGVGKSTLANTLVGDGRIATGGIREADDKGRHTTTARQMHRLPGGAWLVDTPGMRELQLTDVQTGIDDVFAEITELASDCRFGDCTHDTEPGCAVTEAVERGLLDSDRVRRWRKLRREEAKNRASIAERRASDKATGRLYKAILSDSHRRKGR